MKLDKIRIDAGGTKLIEQGLLKIRTFSTNIENESKRRLQVAQWPDYRPNFFFALQKNIAVVQRTTAIFIQHSTGLC